MLVKVLRRRRRRMKVNFTREIIGYPRTRREKRVKGIEAVSNTIKIFVDVLDGTLKVSLLLYSEFGSSNSVRGLILRVV